MPTCDMKNLNNCKYMRKHNTWTQLSDRHQSSIDATKYVDDNISLLRGLHIGVDKVTTCVKPLYEYTAGKVCSIFWHIDDGLFENKFYSDYALNLTIRKTM